MQPCLTLKHPDSQFQSLQIVDAQLRQLLRQVIFGLRLEGQNLLIKLLGDLGQRRFTNQMSGNVLDKNAMRLSPRSVIV